MAKPNAKAAPADELEEELPEEVIVEGDEPEDDAPDDHASESEEADDTSGEGADEVAGGEEIGEREERVAARPASRGERRIGALAERARADRERADRAERELAAEREQRRRQVDPAEERSRLALMTPEERMEYRLDQAARTSAAREAALEFRLNDATDKSAFDAKASSDPIYKKYAPKVEAELARLRGIGQNIGREQLMTYFVGQAALAARGSGGNRQERRAAASRVRKAQASPAGARSDTASGDRRGSNDTPKKRLEGVSI